MCEQDVAPCQLETVCCAWDNTTWTILVFVQGDRDRRGEQHLGAVFSDTAQFVSSAGQYAVVHLAEGL